MHTCESMPKMLSCPLKLLFADVDNTAEICTGKSMSSRSQMIIRYVYTFMTLYIPSDIYKVIKNDHELMILRIIHQSL